MEKFMLIFIGGLDPATLKSPEEMQAAMQEWLDWVDKLKKEGRYEGGEPLDPTGKGVTGRKTCDRWPFAEGKELVGGFFIIKAKNIDGRLRLQKIVLLKHNGRVEVRQVMKM